MSAHDLSGTLVNLFFFLFIGGFIFLVCREVVCWYWKINKTVELLTEIRDLLQDQVLEQTQEKPAKPAPPPQKPTKPETATPPPETPPKQRTLRNPTYRGAPIQKEKSI